MRPQKLKKDPTYPSASGCAEQKIAPDLPRRPVDLNWQSMKICQNILHKKVLSETEKMVKHFFIHDLGWKLSQLLRTLEIHLTRDEKVKFDY